MPVETQDFRAKTPRKLNRKFTKTEEAEKYHEEKEGKIKITEIKKTQNTTIGQSDRNQKSTGGNLTGDA